MFATKRSAFHDTSAAIYVTVCNGVFVISCR